MKLNFCGQRMTLPEQMDEPGTMLMDGKPCPTHQIVDAARGYTVCMGEQFWGAALETLSSFPVQVSAEVVHPAGFEPAAFAFGGQRSIQMSYGCAVPMLSSLITPLPSARCYQRLCQPVVLQIVFNQ